MAGRWRGPWLDPRISGGRLSLRALPSLVLIPPLIWLCAVQLDLLPSGGWGGGLIDIYWIGGVLAVPIPDPHIYIPLVAFTLPGFAGVARLVRVTALRVQTGGFVRAARATGLRLARPCPGPRTPARAKTAAAFPRRFRRFAWRWSRRRRSRPRARCFRAIPPVRLRLF